MRRLLAVLLMLAAAAGAVAQLSLANFSATGTIHLQARITAQIDTRGNGQENIWASAAWEDGGVSDPTGTLDEGSMTLSGVPGNAVEIRRFAKWDDSRDRLILNATSGTGDLGALFDQSTDPYRLSVVREVSGTPTVVTWPVPSRGGNAGFVDWWRTGVPEANMTLAMWQFLDAIASGDSVIFAIHQGDANYTTPPAQTVIGYVGDIEIVREYVGDIEIIAEYVGAVEVRQ